MIINKTKLKKHERIFNIINLVLIVIIVLSILSINISIISAQSSVSYCCEKTNTGAYCINAPSDECDSDYRQTPTSCEATSYCRKGCCYNSVEGICMENTPEIVCNQEGGVWEDSADCSVPQCELGCCIIRDQAAFVTLVRCKKLSSFYGVENDFRTDVADEFQCISLVHAKDEGACVYESDFIKTCERTIREECESLDAEGMTNQTTTFYEGYLCSNERLGTNCGPTKKTTCVEGKDGVYFVDSCGNIANIYDALQVDNKEYWSFIKDIDESCGYGEDNADNPNCGNCDYLLGSFCREYKRGEDRKPAYGDYICRDLDCKFRGETYKHGETWCASEEEDLPGARYFRYVCYQGAVTVEPCADYRQEICIQDTVMSPEGEFRNAACRVNRWQDCVSQEEEDDCLNNDLRDCEWINGVEGLKLNTGTSGENGDDDNSKRKDGICVPEHPPGLEFWQEGDSQGTCSQIVGECKVKFSKKLGGDWDCVENCECLGDSWENQMQGVCSATADCGMKTNYIGVSGSGEGYKYKKKKTGDVILGWITKLFGGDE